MLRIMKATMHSVTDRQTDDRMMPTVLGSNELHVTKLQ